MPGPAEFYVEEKSPHLGGYIIGGDPATYFPDLWQWLVEALGVRSVVDVGCGEGHALRWFEESGCRVLGIDGIKQDHPHIFAHDFAKDAPYLSKEYDLAWSCEFVEHVEERYVPNFLDTFGHAKLVAMTHAEPGQPGHHHVNCQDPEYWMGALAAVGFHYDDVLTWQARGRAALNRNPINHFARSGLVFRRHS